MNDKKMALAMLIFATIFGFAFFYFVVWMVNVLVGMQNVLGNSINNLDFEDFLKGGMPI